MDPDHQSILARLEAQDQKLEAIYQSVEKGRKYFLLSMWVTIAFFVLPLVALIFIVPWFLSSMLGAYEGLL